MPSTRTAVLIMAVTTGPFGMKLLSGGAGQVGFHLDPDLVLELQRPEEAGVRRDAVVGLPHRGGAPVPTGPGGFHLQPHRLRLAMQGERPLDGPARAGGDDAGRGEGRRPAAEDLARLIQDVAAVLVAERLGAPGPFNDGQRAEVELGSELRRRGAACFWHGDRRRPAGYLDRQVVPGPRG